MTKERFFIEVNATNSTMEDGYLTITLPYEKQSAEGVDFYFSEELINAGLFAKSIEISPAPLNCFWNWTHNKYGNAEYENALATPLDLSKFAEAGKEGSFGFSGYTIDESEITIEIELA